MHTFSAFRADRSSEPSTLLLLVQSSTCTWGYVFIPVSERNQTRNPGAGRVVAGATAAPPAVKTSVCHCAVMYGRRVNTHLSLAGIPDRIITAVHPHF